MPEYLIVLIASSCVGAFGWLARWVNDVDRRLDRFEVKVAEEYVTKEQLAKAIDRLEGHFIRLEQKFDAHVIVTPENIASLIQKYKL